MKINNIQQLWYLLVAQIMSYHNSILRLVLLKHFSDAVVLLKTTSLDETRFRQFLNLFMRQTLRIVSWELCVEKQISNSLADKYMQSKIMKSSVDFCRMHKTNISKI